MTYVLPLLAVLSYESGRLLWLLCRGWRPGKAGKWFRLARAVRALSREIGPEEQLTLTITGSDIHPAKEASWAEQSTAPTTSESPPPSAARSS